MKKKIPYLKELAAAIAYNYSTLYKVYTGTNRASVELGRLLELATGIDRRKWQYKDEFGCPWTAWRESGFRIKEVPEEKGRQLKKYSMPDNDLQSETARI